MSVAAALAFAPIFLALVCAQRLKALAPSTTAFRANLLDAMIGVLEYLPLISGYRSLLVVKVLR